MTQPTMGWNRAAARKLPILVTLVDIPDSIGGLTSLAQAQVSEKKAQDAKLIRVPADKLDHLINLVGELVIAGASEEEADAAAPATLSIEDLAVLSVDRAQEDNLRIKDAISQVVAEHPLSDGSLANRKQVYNAVLAMKG